MGGVSLLEEALGRAAGASRWFPSVKADELAEMIGMKLVFAKGLGSV
jgi:hypothetical protein